MSIYLTKQAIEPSAKRVSPTGSGGPVRRILAKAKQRWQQRQMVMALQQLDDRLLADIGINRGEIPRVVAGLNPQELRMRPIARTPRNADQNDYMFLQAA